MSFIVTVKERLNASYNVPTVCEAIDKAQSLSGQGKVIIIDPHNDDWTPEYFGDARTLGERPEIKKGHCVFQTRPLGVENSRTLPGGRPDVCFGSGGDFIRY